MIKARKSCRKTENFAMAVPQIEETAESFMITDIKNIVQYKRGPGKRNTNINKSYDIIIIH